MMKEAVSTGARVSAGTGVALLNWREQQPECRVVCQATARSQITLWGTILALLVALSISARAALPSGWGNANLGSPAYPGSGDYVDGLWTLRGGGADIWGTSDQFYFCTNSLSGDGSITVKVLSQTGTDPYAQAGVMMRPSAGAGSPEASVVATRGNEVNFRYRLTAGGTTSGAFLGGVSLPVWLRLSRSGNTFSASWSSNGVNWAGLGSAQTISMSSPALAGLCVTAHNNSLTNVVTLTNVAISVAAPVPADLANALLNQAVWPLPQLNVASNALTPRMGWNSWNIVNGNPGPSEALILSTADALVTNGLAAAGYNYVVMDCTWIATPGRGYRDGSGNLIVAPNYWPNGMKYVSDYVHAKGLRMGGYSDIGTLGYAITNAQIGMRGYHQQDADQFAAWEWDYIKIDDHGPGNFYEAAAAVANNASNRPMVISLSCPQTDVVKFGPRIANSYRVSSDITLDYTRGSVAWSSILREFDASIERWFTQAPGHWNDPDFLCTGLNGISDLEGRSHFNMWCLLGAPLMLGTDVRKTGGGYPPALSAATLETIINAEVIAIDQDALGAICRPVATDVYAKPLGSYTSGQYGILLLNRSSSPMDLTVNWPELGLVAGSAATVRDLWAHSNLGSFTNSYTAYAIPAHGSVVLKVAGAFDWNRPRTYEAEWAYNSFSGDAYYVPNTAGFSSRAYVTGVGNGLGSAFQFNIVSAPSNGLYQVDIHYGCAVARTAQLSVNGGGSTNLTFPATGGDSVTASITLYLQLAAGNTNTLTFGNPSGLAPNFDKLVVSSGSPTTLSATARDGVVNLAWTAVAYSTSYKIYRGTISGGQSVTPLAAGLTGSAFADTNVSNGTTYFYTVTAINPVLGGESPPSVEASAKPVYATASTAYRAALLAAAPQVWWRFSETNGAVIYDSVGTRHGTNAGAVTIGVTGPRPAEQLGFEMTNSAAQFVNGTPNSWFNVPALNLNTSTATFLAWIYPTASQADYAGILFCRAGGTVAGVSYGGSFGANGGMIGYTWNNDQNTWNWSSGLTPPVNEWSLVAVVVQPTRAVVYLINRSGVQTATNSLAHATQSFGSPSTLGTDPYAAAARVFTGRIDEVAVFNYALTPAQIESLHANGRQLDDVSVNMQTAGVNLNLTWSQGTLLQATNLSGPWLRASSSASPFLVTPTNESMFYRVLLKQ
jgi:hypothetical protein